MRMTEIEAMRILLNTRMWITADVWNLPGEKTTTRINILFIDRSKIIANFETGVG